jgi:sulfate adenylyltransferase subunit 1
VIGVSAQLIENAQALESLLIQQGVVAIAKVGLTTEQTVLLRETGVVVITTTVDGTDTDITAETVEEAAEKIVELVRL